MKKLLTAMLAAAFTVSAASAQSLKFQTVTDSVGIKHKGVPIYSLAKVAFPVDGPAKLVNSLKTTLSERLGITMSSTDDGITFVRKVMNKKVAELKKMYVEDYGEDEMTRELYEDNYVEKVWESDKLLTIMYYGNSFHGGPHEDHFAAGVTFRKSDGVPFGNSILINNAWEKIQDKVAASLRKQYELNTNSELAEILNGDGIICTDDKFYIPMPFNPPYVENDNLVFLYGTYEIAPFAVGMPEVKIPLKDIQQYLSAELKAQLK